MIGSAARPRRVLVTGGAGVIGSHLIDALLDRGETVFCLDTYETGDRGNLSHHADNPRLTLLERDVTDPPHLDVDQIYNLACPASPPQYKRDPIRTLRTSVLGAMAMLDLAHRTHARILQASTSEVYGDPFVHPQPESYNGNVNPIGPRACYDEGKRCAETLFFDYRRIHGVSIKVARIFNTYGPRMQSDDGRVVTNFIIQALRGTPLTIYGDGLQTRSLCYVADTVDGLIRLMESPDDVTGPVNLGNPTELTMLELAEKIIGLTGSSSPVLHLPLPEDDPRQRRPDISLARDVLGWAPNVALQDGLRATILHLRQKLVREGASCLPILPAALCHHALS
jgi:UDP-glucuronate decarboxylase